MRIVVTGLGAVTALGNDPQSFWDGMKQGRSGGARIEFPEYPEYRPLGCPVQSFDPADWMDAREARRWGRSSQFALATAKQAVDDSGLDLDREDTSRIGIVFNTGGGGMSAVAEAERVLLTKGPRAVSPFVMPNAMPNCVSALVSIAHGLRGPVVTSTLACAAGNYAFLEAAYLMQRGEADVVVVGATESAVMPQVLASFDRMGALSHADDPRTASRPFDRDRDGLLFGEGAAAFVLETEEHALARGAAILAEVLGGGLTADAYHMTAPEPEGRGAIGAMQRALTASRRDPADIDVVFAHATSTPLGDIAETKAIKAVFGKHARRLPVPATKSQLGHTFGAAGAMSALAAIQAIREGIVCPTINYVTADPECDLDCVPNEARELEIRTAMINAFGFGGQNAVLVLGAYA